MWCTPGVAAGVFCFALLAMTRDNLFLRSYRIVSPYCDLKADLKNHKMSKGPVSQFIQHHFRHFNAAALMDAAKGYEKHLTDGGKMMITLAGAMSTAELGISLAEMIRQDKVHIISCTGANLEEDIMNLVAHSHYKRVPNYRDLTPQEEWELLENHYNRVTDTCIPEEEAFRRIQEHIHKLWKEADDKGERYLPHEFMYKMLLSGVLKKHYEIDPKDSWMNCETGPLLIL